MPLASARQHPENQKENRPVTRRSARWRGGFLSHVPKAENCSRKPAPPPCRIGKNPPQQAPSASTGKPGRRKKKGRALEDMRYATKPGLGFFVSSSSAWKQRPIRRSPPPPAAPRPPWFDQVSRRAIGMGVVRRKTPPCPGDPIALPREQRREYRAQRRDLRVRPQHVARKRIALVECADGLELADEPRLAADLEEDLRCVYCTITSCQVMHCTAPHRTARRGKAMQFNTRQGDAMQGKACQSKAREGKGRQCNAV